MEGSYDEQETVSARGAGQYPEPGRQEVYRSTEHVIGDEPAVGGMPSAGETVVLAGGPVCFAWLAVTSGPLRGRLIRLQPKGMVIGREGRCDIVVDDEAVSGLHARVRSVKQDESGRPVFQVHDMDSSNGTKVNNENIVRVDLHDNDRIELGKTTMVFKQV